MYLTLGRLCFACRYRPPCPVVVATNNEYVIRHTNTTFAQHPFKVSGELKDTAVVQSVIDSLSIEGKKVKRLDTWISAYLVYIRVYNFVFGVNRGTNPCALTPKVVLVCGLDGGSADESATVKSVFVNNDGKIIDAVAEPISSEYVNPLATNATLSNR